MAMVRLLTKLLRHEEIGKRIVPIIPDEARTLVWTRCSGRSHLLTKRTTLRAGGSETPLLQRGKDGQTGGRDYRSGAMSSFIAAGRLGIWDEMIPFFLLFHV
jgi:pyruvate dehydrogenase E1 component